MPFFEIKETAGFRNMKIMVIDDDETFLAKMEKILILEEHSVITAISGEKALSMLNENGFELILMDLKMPGLSGVDLIQKIREAGCNAIIIMITGYGTIESAVQTTKAGAYDYILKPFEFSLLKNKIKEVESELNLRKNLAVPGPIEKSRYGDLLKLENLNDYKSPFLVISNENPEEIISNYNLTQAIPLWLDYKEDENTISPTKLYMIKLKIEEFVKSNEAGTIICKGIEELLKIHEWDNFKQFLIYLQSDVLSSNYSLLLLVESDYFMDISYQSLFRDALSILINPVFHNIIELLSHPLRKGIITLLKSEDNLNFNKIVKKLNVDRSSILAFHINKLVQGSILKKEENLYGLTSRGKYISELIFLLEKLGFSDPHSQVKIFNYS